MIRGFRLLATLYRRNKSKNILMVIFMFITNIIFSGFLIFFTLANDVESSLGVAYFEHLSLDVSLFERMETNHDLVSVKSYKRPSIDYMEAFMREVGQFTIRPDYTNFFNILKLSVFDKEITTPHIVTYQNENKAIGINEAFYTLLNRESNINSNNIELRLRIDVFMYVDGEEVRFQFDDYININFIYEEPPFLSVPKLFLPQSYVDLMFGEVFIKEGLTLNNYLLNLSPEHELANYRLRCHFETIEQQRQFVHIATSVSDENSGIEITSDPLNKIKSFLSLYEYLRILSNLFLVLIILTSLVIYGIISYTSITSLRQQLSLLNLLGSRKIDLYAINLFFVNFNFLVGTLSFLFIKPVITFLESLFLRLMNLSVSLSIRPLAFFQILITNYFLLFILVSILFLIEIRRPLLYLLLDD